MQRYICHHCDNLECTSSICPVCGGKTDSVNTQIYWCKTCNVPSYSKTCDCCHSICDYISTDIRPVFAEERLLIEIILGMPMQFVESSVWAAGGGVYFIDGQKVKINLVKAIHENEPAIVASKLKEYEELNKKYSNYSDSKWLKGAIEVNKTHIQSIEYEAMSFIRNEAGNVNLSSMFVSFSCGKDSTVTSNLVREALGTEKIIHIYGDTTLEYPDSFSYLSRFKKEHPKMPLIVSKTKDQDFLDLCMYLGPPSRVLRWCCTVFKTGSINILLETLFKGKSQVLAFHGIRRAESSSRRKYDRVSVSPKITKQVVLQPILDWMDFDVWLYILSRNLDFNDAYKKGFSRVGCWCCPNNSNWAEYLAKIYMPEQSMAFTNLLYDFAKKVGKKDWKEYIDSGNWKARQGGNGLENSKSAILQVTECVNNENAYNFELTRPITDALYELFKPFGIIDKTMGNQRLGEVYVLNRSDSMPLLKIAGKLGQNRLRLSILNYRGPFRARNNVESYLKAQITKYQTCIGCYSCPSICKHSAIRVENKKPGGVDPSTINYQIDEKKCVGCLECILHHNNGCYIKKVVRVSNDKLQI